MTFIPANAVSDALSGGPNIVTQTLSGLGILPPSWGIFNLSGQSVITFDAVTGVEYRQDSLIADAPQERGAFTSYDKVATPFDVRLTFVSGGSLSNRQALLRTVKRISRDLNLYDVVTPEETYLNCNVQHYSYRRAEGEAGLIEVTVHLLEIRETGEGTLSNTDQQSASAPTTAQPDGADQQNGGQVQTTPTPSQQQTQVTTGLTADAAAGRVS